MMNPRASPADCDMTTTAVANVLCFGGNQTELRRGGVFMTGGPMMPIAMCPR